MARLLIKGSNVVFLLPEQLAHCHEDIKLGYKVRSKVTSLAAQKELRLSAEWSGCLISALVVTRLDKNIHCIRKSRNTEIPDPT